MIIFFKSWTIQWVGLKVKDFLADDQFDIARLLTVDPTKRVSEEDTEKRKNKPEETPPKKVSPTVKSSKKKSPPKKNSSSISAAAQGDTKLANFFSTNLVKK